MVSSYLPGLYFQDIPRLRDAMRRRAALYFSTCYSLQLATSVGAGDPVCGRQPNGVLAAVVVACTEDPELTCPMGSFAASCSNQIGFSGCCQAYCGYASLGGGHASTQSRCVPGKFASRGSARCNACPAGQFTSATATCDGVMLGRKSECALVSSGHYTVMADSSGYDLPVNQLPCPAGKYSLGGYHECSSCGLGRFSTSG